MNTPLRILIAGILGFCSSWMWASPTHLMVHTLDGENHAIALADGLTVKLNESSLEIASAGTPSVFSIENVASLSYSAPPLGGASDIPAPAPAIRFTDSSIGIDLAGSHTLIIFDAGGRTVASRAFTDYINVCTSELPAGVLMLSIDRAPAIKIAVK